MRNRKRVAVAAVLSLFCGSAAAVVAVGLVEASRVPFYAEVLTSVEEALERELGKREVELARTTGETGEPVAPAADASPISTANTLLNNALNAAEAARDAAVTALEQEKAALAAVINERDSLQKRVEQLRAEVPAVSTAPLAVAQTEWDRIADATRRQRETGLPVELTNSIGMKFVVIPAGTFLMGSATGESNEQPVHEVTISQPYYLGVYEVTERDWTRVMGGSKGSSIRPVVEVSWDDAVSFCAKLSAIPAERAAGRVYRLPTEAEWEYACRAGTTTAYSLGDDEALSRGFSAWFDRTSGGKARPVGQSYANAFWIYDMHGNVWEWCSDWYGDYGAGPATDPQGLAAGSARVLRGGSWRHSARFCRSAYRYWNNPSYRVDDSGFRLALRPSGK